MNHRTVVPEILDRLPAADPAAQASRRDLAVLNRVMGNPAWFGRKVRRHLRAGDRVLELGAGDANLAAYAPAGVAWDAIDRDPPPPGWPGRQWHQVDLREFTDWAAYSVLVGNLVFHHLHDDELRALGHRGREHWRLILACEPRRGWVARLGFALLGPLIRAHPVTQHDGTVSIAAGFAGAELPRLLDLPASTWRWTISGGATGAYRLFAERPPK